MMSDRILSVMLSAVLICLCLLPVSVCAESEQLLVLWDVEGNTQLEQTRSVLVRTMMYMGRACSYQDAWVDFDPADYTAIVICVDESRGLNDQIAALIRGSGRPVYVIGGGGLDQLIPTQRHEGTVVVCCDAEDGSAHDTLLNTDSLLLPAQEGKALGGQVIIGRDASPLCRTVGQVTHLAAFEPDDPLHCALLASTLQSWLWPFRGEPTAYSHDLVLDNIYPFADLQQLMAVTDVMQEAGVPWNLCVMPFYENADFPAMKRFCEYLRYAQSLGVGIILHVPLVSLTDVSAEDVTSHLAITVKALTAYGVYPLALEMPESWLWSEKGLKIASGWRTVLLYSSSDPIDYDAYTENTAYHEGHQLISPAYGGSSFTSSFAQAIYLDPGSDPAALKEQVLRYKKSRRALMSIAQLENVVYSGDLKITGDAGEIRLNDTAVSTVYVPFTYDSDYTYDRGFVQYMTEQIETSNRLILVFVGAATVFFIIAINLSRRSIRRSLLKRRYVDPDPAPSEEVDDP